jgi:hypothetical protein
MVVSMAWRVESRIDRSRWVAHDGDRWTADDATRLNMLAIADGPQLLTPTGPTYVPQRRNDEVAAYLAALSLIPAPVASGDVPDVPRPPAGDVPPDTVY